MKRIIELDKAIAEIKKQLDFYCLPYQEKAIDKTHAVFLLDDAMVYKYGRGNLIYIGINDEVYLLITAEGEERLTHDLKSFIYFIVNDISKNEKHN